MMGSWSYHQQIVLESDYAMAIRYLKESRTMKLACFSMIQEVVRTPSILPNLELCHGEREMV